MGIHGEGGGREGGDEDEFGEHLDGLLMIMDGFLILGWSRIEKMMFRKEGKFSEEEGEGYLWMWTVRTVRFFAICDLTRSLNANSESRVCWPDWKSSPTMRLKASCHLVTILLDGISPS